MKDLVGLSKTKKFIDNCNPDTFPHSLILLGKEGSGKTEICNYIAEKLQFNTLDITLELSEDLIFNIYRYTGIRIYIIDTRKIPQKKQNVFLKLFEEPPSNSFVIVIANSKFQLLPTVINRGTVLNMDSYSKEDLLELCKINNIGVNEKYLHTLLKTPGDVLKLYSNNVNVEDLNKLCELVVNKLKIASLPNTLTIIDKINFKDEYDKMDLKFLLLFLYEKYINTYTENKDTMFLKCGRLVNETIKKLSVDKRLNKKVQMTELLIKLWKLNREI